MGAVRVSRQLPRAVTLGVPATAVQGADAQGDRPRLAAFSGYATTLYLVRFASLIKSAILARFLGPADYGSVAAFATFLAYGAFLDLGLFNGQNREIPVLRGAGQDSEARSVAELAKTGSLLVAFVAAGGLAMVSALQWFGAIPGSWWFSLGLAVAVLAQQSSGVLNSLCYAQERFSLQAKALLIGVVVDLLVSIAAGLAFGVRGVVAVWAAGFIAQWVALRIGIGPICWRPDIRGIGRLIAVGIPIAVVWFANTNLVGVDKLVILNRMGTAPLGLYSIAGVAGVLVTIGPNAVSQMLQPQILRRFGRDGHSANSAQLVRTGQSVSGLVGGSLAALGCAVLPLAVAALLPSYTEATTSAVVLMIASAIFATLHPVAAYFIIHHKQLGLAALYIGISGFNVVLDLVLISFGLGIAGVALGSLVTYVLLYTAVQLWVNRIAGKDGGTATRLWATLEPGALALYGGTIGWAVYGVSRDGLLSSAATAAIGVFVAMTPPALLLAKRYLGIGKAVAS